MEIPYLTLAKWAGIGIVALALIFGVMRAVETVKAWNEAYKAQPGLTAARDQAITARDAAIEQKNKQAETFATSLGTIADNIKALTAKYNAVQAALVKAQATYDASIAHFKELTAHVSPNAAFGSPDDLLVRRSLLDIIANPDTGQLGRGGDSNGKGEAGAGLRGAPGGTDGVPGQRPAAANVQGAVVPATRQGGRRGQKRTAQGRSRRGHGLGSIGTHRTIEAERVGHALPVGFTLGSRQQGKRFAQAVMEDHLSRCGVAVVHG